MSQIDNLNKDVVKEIFKQLKELATAVGSTPSRLGDLPTTTEPANLYQDPVTGLLYRSTA